jgi:hypothetical protein
MNVLRLTHAGLVASVLFPVGCNQSESFTTDTVDFAEAGIEWNLMAECQGKMFDGAFIAPSPIPMREGFGQVETFFIVSEEFDVKIFISKETPITLDGRVLGNIIPVSITWNNTYPTILFSEPNCAGRIFATL